MKCLRKFRAWLLAPTLREIFIMSEALDRLTAEVTEQTTVIQSAATLLSTLAQEIRDNTGDDDALNALADKIDAQTNELAAAVQANTPTDVPPTEPDAPSAA